MFKNRKDAALQLGEALWMYRREQPLVLAIPRGGVETGYYVARALGCDFSVVITRKLGHPYQPELAVGALAEDKSLYLNPTIQRKVSKAMIEKAIEREDKEIKRRIALYRKGKALPPISKRTVILVDDGIATGATLLAALQLCRKRQAAKIVVAAPVSSLGMLKKLQQVADAVVILETPIDYVAVSQIYEEFRNLTDEEVLSFLQAHCGNDEHKTELQHM